LIVTRRKKYPIYKIMEEVSDIYENRKISPEKKISKAFVQLAGIYRLIFAVR